jgi:hypothetical protein
MGQKGNLNEAIYLISTLMILILPPCPADEKRERKYLNTGCALTRKRLQICTLDEKWW